MLSVAVFGTSEFSVVFIPDVFPFRIDWRTGARAHARRLWTATWTHPWLTTELVNVVGVPCRDRHGWQSMCWWWRLHT